MCPIGPAALIYPTVWCFTDILHHDTYPEIDPISQSGSLGKAVLVTGANRGLGKAFVIAYAKSGASHIAIGTRSDASDVVAAVLDAAKDAKREVPVVVQVKIDVCEQASIDAAVDEVQKEFGRLDILVNNSGFMGPSVLMLDQPSDITLHTWDVNFLGPYRVTRAFLPLMLRDGEKTIVFITSVGAQIVAAQTLAYSVSKFALCRLAEFIDIEYGEQVLVTIATPSEH